MKILLADDHALVREGLKRILQQHYGDGCTIYEADCHSAVMSQLTLHKDLDLILLDLSMPGSVEFNTLRAVRHSQPTTPAIVITASEEKHLITKVFSYGVMGYIPKATPHKVMISVIDLVMSGGIYAPPQFLNITQQRFPSSEEPEVEPDPEYELTDRQREILTYLAQGKTNKEIARILDLADTTVRTHLSSIFKILEVSNRTQASQKAKQLGIVVEE